MLNQYTLNDEIVTQALLSVLDSSRPIPVLVGGMAVQAYMPKSYHKLRRATNDVDLLPEGENTKGKLKKELERTLGKSLSNKKFNPKFKKNRGGVEVEIGNSKHPFYIHYATFTSPFWEQNRDWKQREIRESRYIESETGDQILRLRVFRPEDIIANKTRRLNNLYSEGNLRAEPKERYHALFARDFARLHERVDLDVARDLVDGTRGVILETTKRNRGMFTSEIIGLIKEFKAQKDLFDCGILSRLATEGIIDFDMAYFSEAMITPDENYCKIST